MRPIVLDETDNPFLSDAQAGRAGAAFQAQLFFTLARHRQQTQLRQSDLFSQLTICDYLFERDKIYAYLNLDDNELFIYQRLYELLAPDLPVPDLVIYLQTPTDVLRRRLRERARANPDSGAARRRVRPRAERGLQPLLLPLHRHAAAGRRDFAVRSVVGRRGACRSRAPDEDDEQGDEVLRAANVKQSAVGSRRSTVAVGSRSRQCQSTVAHVRFLNFQVRPERVGDQTAVLPSLSATASDNLY